MALPQITALNEDLLNLRRIYEAATPKQRFSIVLQRINNPATYANELVTRVSGVEAYARCLLAHSQAKNKSELSEQYKKHAKSEATVLVTKFLKSRRVVPSTEFGEELWELFRAAEKARNLLVHECTYLDAAKFLPMSHACTEVLMRLSEYAMPRNPESAA